MTQAYIKKAYDGMVPDMKFDKELLRKLKEYVFRFTTRNQEHIDFFGNNLLGVSRPVFTEKDLHEIMEEIFPFDLNVIRKVIYDIPTINNSWKVEPNPHYQIMMWAVHRFLTSPHLTPELRREGAVTCHIISLFKTVTSKINNDYRKFKVSEEIAAAVSAELNKKFSIKIYGNWYKVLEARALNLTEPGSPHYETLMKYDVDKEINYCVTESHNRVVDLLSSQWEILKKVNASTTRFLTQKAFVNMPDGGEILRDMNSNIKNFINRLLSIVGSRLDLIDDEMVNVVCGLMTKPDVRRVKETLIYISDKFKGDNPKESLEIEDTLTELLLHAQSVIYEMVGNSRASISVPSLLLKLRGRYMSGKTSDESIIKVRDNITRYTKDATRVKTEAVINTTRTVVMIYLVAMAMIKK